MKHSGFLGILCFSFFFSADQTDTVTVLVETLCLQRSRIELKKKELKYEPSNRVSCHVMSVRVRHNLRPRVSFFCSNSQRPHCHIIQSKSMIDDGKKKIDISSHAVVAIDCKRHRRHTKDTRCRLDSLQELLYFVMFLLEVKGCIKILISVRKSGPKSKNITPSVTLLLKHKLTLFPSFHRLLTPSPPSSRAKVCLLFCYKFFKNMRA